MKEKKTDMLKKKNWTEHRPLLWHG